MTGAHLIDEYFIENRTRLLDLAAFLDRLDRAADPAVDSDFRMRAFREALRVLSDSGRSRVEQIQRIFSDPTTEPTDGLDHKSACGAYRGWQKGER
jgi:hypothetical protein